MEECKLFEYVVIGGIIFLSIGAIASLIGMVISRPDIHFRENKHLKRMRDKIGVPPQ